MSTAAPPAAAPAAAPSATVAFPPPAEAPARARGTAHRLRSLSAALVAAGLLVGLVGALTFAYLSYAVGRAEADTAQLIRVQNIQTNLLSADATATNAFLVGGLEAPEQRAAYDQALSSTATLIAEAAQAQPADADALAALNAQVLDYGATIEQARANNRQGLPVGAQYLRSASAQLRADALPIVDVVVQANSERAADRMSLRLGYLPVVIALGGLVAFVLAHLWLARRFRRRINPGVLAGALVMLLALVVSVVTVQRVGGAVRDIRAGGFAQVNQAAEARIQANNAKSNESLTLIARGSGAAFEQAWTASADAVTQNLTSLGDANLLDRWTAYTEIHTDIRELDDGGSWDAAVAQATGTGDDSANVAFAAFDTQLAGYLDRISAEAADNLGDQRPALITVSIVLLLAGIAAALLGRRGVAARLKEYR